MRRILAAVLTAVIVGAGVGLAQNRLGVGGSFALGTPVFDVFLEVPGESTATRFTLGIWATAPGGNLIFSVDGSFLLTPLIGGFQAYFGGGVGGWALVAGGLGGVAAINLTVNALAGAYIPVTETFSFYAQVKLLGVLDLTNMSITALLMPGFGLCVRF